MGGKHDKCYLIIYVLFLGLGGRVTEVLYVFKQINKHKTCKAMQTLGVSICTIADQFSSVYLFLTTQSFFKKIMHIFIYFYCF